MNNLHDLFSALNPNEAYYNTTNLKGDELKEAETKAFNQTSVVYNLFTRYGRLSPSQCLQKYIEVTRLTPPPITSIRRAITKLTDAGKLEKTDERVMGMFGKKEYVWEKL
jgi:hypothetical protein